MSPILIVEDNEKNLKLVRDVLQFKGYETLEAMTGARRSCGSRGSASPTSC